MENELDKAMNKLSEMLSTDDGKKELESLISAFGGVGESNDNNKADNSSPFGDIDPAMLLNIKHVFDTFQKGNDPRTNLLTALKPYLSASRHNHVDNAIKIMSLGRLPGVLKGLK